MFQPSAVCRPQGRHRGIHTCCGTEDTGEGERETTRGRREEEYEEEEENSGGVVEALINLTRETAGTEEETLDGLEDALGVDVEEDMDS